VTTRLTHGTLSWRVRVACFVLASFTTGCSFVFVQPLSAEARRSGRPLNCTTNTLAPGLDAAATAVNVIGTLLAVNNSDEDYRGSGHSRPAAITFGLLSTAVTLSSSIYGFNATSDCREALGMESSSRTHRTRPHSRDVAAEIAEEEAAQARAAARAAEQAKAAGQAAQESMPGAGRTDAGAPQ
jgi:hypothetical protein